MPLRPLVRHQRGHGARRRDRRDAAPALGALVLVLALGLSGCSSDDAGASAEGTTGGASEPTPSATTAEPVITRASIVRVDGKLDAAARARMRSRVRDALDVWIDGAYGGAYPRKDFSDAFDSFTKGAARRARQDAALMTNTAVGPDVDEVRAVRREARLEVLGVRGAAVAVTARVDLRFVLTGKHTRRDTISGELYLTLDKSGSGRGAPSWRVFGYDLRRKEA